MDRGLGKTLVEGWDEKRRVTLKGRTCPRKLISIGMVAKANQITPLNNATVSCIEVFWGNQRNIKSDKPVRNRNKLKKPDEGIDRRSTDTRSTDIRSTDIRRIE
jgi:hypothetical protein